MNQNRQDSGARRALVQCGWRASLALLLALPGCQAEGDGAAADSAAAKSTAAKPTAAVVTRRAAPRSTQRAVRGSGQDGRSTAAKVVTPDAGSVIGQAMFAQRRDANATRAGELQPPAVDAQRVAAAGIRLLEGKHISIYTDLPSAEAIDELPQVFDAAVPLWCEYFRLPPRSAERWQMRGCIMQRRERFLAAGLLPDDLPEFLHGYALGGQLWLLEQPSDYYRRHLLLHEGTHAFMQAQLHGMGPPWFAEGLAELLATHRWQDGQLQLHVFPADKEQVPHWGRITLVRDEYAAGRSMSLERIAEYGPTAHLETPPYGWCWAAGAFLDGHPDYSERFRQLPRRADQSSPQFAQFYRQLFRSDVRQRDEQWQLFVFHLEYGYDLAREAIVYTPSRTEQGDTSIVTIQADRGWQSTGVQVTAGTAYRLTASGRYQIGDEPRIWWCEPGGVTIQYCHGYPLGMLLAGVSDQDQPIQGLTPLAAPEPIGLERELVFATSGTLFLRINDAPSALDDNAGQLQVEIRAVSGP